MLALGLKGIGMGVDNLDIEKYSEAFRINGGYRFKVCETKEEQEGLYKYFSEVVLEGGQFPYTDSSWEEYQKRFFSPGYRVFIVISDKDQVIGGFYLRSNEPTNQVANAAYMLDKLVRGRGLGQLIVETSLDIARQLGFKQMQYNQVYKRNVKACRLYDKLDFKILNPNGQEDYWVYLKNL